MTFEEWGEPQHGVVNKVALIKAMYADWKAEREDWQEGIEGLKLSVSGLRIERGCLQAKQEKLIGALAETTVMLTVLHGINDKTKCADVKCAFCLRADTNRAVLSEVMRKP